MMFCSETVNSLVDDCSVMVKPKGSSSARNQIKTSCTTSSSYGKHLRLTRVARKPYGRLLETEDVEDLCPERSSIMCSQMCYPHDRKRTLEVSERSAAVDQGRTRSEPFRKSASGQKMLSSTAFLMLMLCATDAMKVSKPGADLLSPLHPDYLSKVC
ncbi:unnamed protein product [Toxocara canis]|uniref:Uncharacterized protein n=1 Tax=Toxocara canis TaxID=6265 RepID=A0A183U5N2_TOXCA|nr:unnamed protein product [Toxocara canis]